MNRNLRTSLYIVVTSVIIICATVAITLVYRMQYHALLKAQKQNLLDRTEDYRSSIQLMFAEEADDLGGVAKHRSVQRFLNKETDVSRDDILGVLNTVQGDRSDVTLYVVDRAGTVLVSTDPRFENNDFSGRAYIDDALKGYDSFEIAIGKESQELGMYMGRVIRSEDGQLLGLVALKIDPSALHFLDEVNDRGETIYVTDSEGVVLYSSDRTNVLHTFVPFGLKSRESQESLFKRYSVSDLPSITATDHFTEIYVNANTQGIVEQNTEYFDQNNIYSYTKNEAFPVTVIVGSSEAILIDPYTSSLTTLVLLLCLIVIFAVVTILIFIYRVIQPLEQLDNIAQHILKDRTETKLESIPGLESLTQSLQKVLHTARSIKDQADHEVEIMKTRLENSESELENQQLAILNVLEDAEESRNDAVDLATDLEKFKLAVDGVADVVVITDNHGIIIYTNRVSQKVTGFTAKESIGKKPGQLWGGKMSHDFYVKMWKKIAHDKKPFSGEVNNKRKDGSEYIAQLHISPILDENKNVLFYVGVQRDVTRERQIDRMKTEFISLASHQLRTPLSAMKWYLEMLLEGDAGKLSKEQLKYTHEVYSSNQRMIDLVNALLNVSRLESGRIMIDPEKTDVKILIEAVVQEVSVIAKQKRQTIEVKVSRKVPEIMLDPKLIRNVFLNLLTNAVKYSPTKTTISVKVEVRGKDMYAEVKDDGYGIPHEQYDRVFTKFFRATNITSSDTEGSGLGLYLVKAIVDSSGGTIGFESKEKTRTSKTSGTTFWFTLPLKGMKKKKGEVRVDD